MEICLGPLPKILDDPNNIYSTRTGPLSLLRRNKPYGSNIEHLQLRYTILALFCSLLDLPELLLYTNVPITSIYNPDPRPSPRAVLIYL